jgi:small conductance mechanosensitive channel
MGDKLQALEQVQTAAIELGMKFGPRLLVALVILFAGYLAGKWAARITARMLEGFKLEPPVRNLLERAVRVLVLGLFLIMALQNLGVELLPLIAGLGVAGAGVALAMQGVLGNAAAGLTIIFTRPFRVGDYISIVKEEGQVLDVTLFNTILGHADLSRVVIPNRKIVGEILHNYAGVRQLGVEVGVSYDTDLSKALRTISEVLEANPRVLQDPKPLISVSRLANARIAIAVSPWVKVPDFGPATGEVYRAIVESFRSHGIAIPVTHYEPRMLTAGA